VSVDCERSTTPYFVTGYCSPSGKLDLTRSSDTPCSECSALRCFQWITNRERLRWRESNDSRPQPPPPHSCSIELTLRAPSPSEERVGRGFGERGNPIQPSSSPRPSPPPSSEEREKTASVSDANSVIQWPLGHRGAGPGTPNVLNVLKYS